MGRHLHSRLLVAFLVPGLALAAFCSGFLNRLPLEVREPALAAYLAVGGTLDDICGGHGHGTPHCEACRTPGSAVLPEPRRDGRHCRAVVDVAWGKSDKSETLAVASRRMPEPRAPPARMG